jgi:hypothetical protein
MLRLFALNPLNSLWAAYCEVAGSQHAPTFYRASILTHACMKMLTGLGPGMEDVRTARAMRINGLAHNYSPASCNRHHFGCGGRHQ